MIDYFWDRWKKEKTLPMADINGRLKNSSAYLVACGGVKVILNKEQLTKGYNLSELIKGHSYTCKTLFRRKKGPNRRQGLWQK